MTNEAGFVFALIAVAGVLMASNRVRYDFVALIVVLALALSGTLTIGESLSGFGNSVVILVACLLVLGEMLDRTGVARAVGDAIMRHGGRGETGLLVLIMISTALLGSVMSSTAVVAIFIPVILRIAQETANDKARFLMPMSYAALISGMLTLIATPPNLVVSDELVAQGYQPFGLFSFFLIGASVLVVAVLFVLFWGRYRLKTKSTPDEQEFAISGTTLAGMWETFGLDVHSATFRVTGKVLSEDVDKLTGSGTAILVRLRPGAKGKYLAAMFREGMELLPGDIVFIRGAQDALADLSTNALFAKTLGFQKSSAVWIDQLGLADVLIHPEAAVIGRQMHDAPGFETKGIEIVGLVRNSEPVENPNTTVLQSGDRLMLAGSWEDLDRAVERHDMLVLLSFPNERTSVPPAATGFWAAIAIMATMVALTVSELVSITTAVLMAAVAAVLLRTLSAEDAYRAVKLPSLVLIAGMLPLADALQATGGSDIIVDQLLYLVGEASPRAVMAAIFVLTALLGLVLSNTASAVLVAPIAISAAEALGISPYPVALCVLIAASASFSTPISTPVVTLVVAPGGYSFADFLKLGVPLTILTGTVAVVIAPMLFPY
ncbi:SLC13 family permease [Ruegeria atlantica]|uniref:SLC13 family permease n=1 Tax=Ruegeria atlantica TaxID=81569 RepID=UPI001480C632|nr:SLC13 family permease [Ruegeria atlantica]